ncbi:hypothetical protein ACFQL7_20600 [Halocatena marina]|uniref:DRBM domain-containing protein n=1 Tax=Halocatena marina TaxID=2934937 RepID=A0ABD5YVX2_9EURY|nr:hypothetical protein [Halocatena marina]
MSITLQVVDDETYHTQNTVPDGWHKTANYDTFVKWQYKDTPYRVVAHLEEGRGHWCALFTSTLSPESHTVRGNCGGGNAGRTLAVAAAQQFLQENSNGCPPPSEMN